MSIYRITILGFIDLLRHRSELFSLEDCADLRAHAPRWPAKVEALSNAIVEWCQARPDIDAALTPSTDEEVRLPGIGVSVPPQALPNEDEGIPLHNAVIESIPMPERPDASSIKNPSKTPADDRHQTV